MRLEKVLCAEDTSSLAAQRAAPWLSLRGPVMAIVAVPLFIAAFDNGALWSRVAAVTSLDDHRYAILLSLFAIQSGPLVLLLALVPTGRLLKLVASTLLVTAAVCGYFMSTYGTLIDTTMIRNVAETSLHESVPLLTAGFLRHVVLFGVAPSVLLYFAPLAARSWKLGFAARSGLLALNGLWLVGTVYVNYGSLAFFAHQHREVRFMINPAYPIYAYLGYLLRSDDAVPAERVLLDATVSGAALRRERKTLLVLVVGETARADRFQYNGYSRATNAYTSGYGLVNYRDVTACGTSTADSLPCLFSRLDRKRFTHEAAAHSESLLGTLQRLGVHVLWRDNSTGCKDVCDPNHFEQYVGASDPELCDATGCFDEILLEDFDDAVRDTTRDQLVVLHQRGSHGPAYHTNVPADRKAFFPECSQVVLRNCAVAELENAYDNTILYTDYFLSRLVETLLQRASEYDVAMLYVSDHGESLGENGLYLHGFPYALAPKEQLAVPMLFWAARSFLTSHGLNPLCLQATADQPVSHDAVFHTVLRLFGVASPDYREELDLFAQCRRDGMDSERLSKTGSLP